MKFVLESEKYYFLYLDLIYHLYDFVHYFHHYFFYLYQLYPFVHFSPIFFIHLGSQLVVDWSQAGDVIVYGIVAGIIVAFFQFWSAYFAGKKTSGLPDHEATLLGIGMLPYDIVAFVVLGIATETGLISTDGKFIITVILTILVINIMTSVAMFYYRKEYLSKKEYHETLEEQQAKKPSH